MHTLKTAENHSIPYGVIRGEARPVKRTEVIRSPHVPDAIGLLQRVKTREHKSEWSKTTRLWYVSYMKNKTCGDNQNPSNFALALNI